MKQHKKYLPLASLLLIALLITGLSPLAAIAFSGILPVPAGAPSVPTITLSSYSLGVGQTATVTFTFPTAPSSFTTGNITAQNGTITGLAVTGDPKVYTATFTPTASINAPTNTISINQTVGMTSYSGTGSHPYAIAFDGTNMWTANFSDSSVSKISPTGSITTYTGTDAQPFSIAFDGTNMWTANFSGSNSVSEISPTGTVTTYTGTGSHPDAIAFDGTNMWTANRIGNSVSEITPTGTITTYPGTGVTPSQIAFDGTNMWTANQSDNSVSEISPTGTVTTYTGTGAGPYGIAFDGTNMWTANYGSNSVSKITPTGTITTYTGTGVQPTSIAFDGTNMWIVNQGDNSISEVTPSGTITTYTGIGFNPVGIAFDGSNMWTANEGSNSVTKVFLIAPASSSNYAIDTVSVVAPTLTASAATSVSPTDAIVNGSITDTGGANATIEGFNWGTTSGYGSTTVSNGSFGIGAFSADIPGLSPSTTYHYQAYATNSAGTGTSSPDATFTTADAPRAEHGAPPSPPPAPAPTPPAPTPTPPPAPTPVTPPAPVTPAPPPPDTTPTPPAPTPTPPPAPTPVTPPAPVTPAPTQATQDSSATPSSGGAASGSASVDPNRGGVSQPPPSTVNLLGYVHDQIVTTLDQTQQDTLQTIKTVHTIFVSKKGNVVATTVASSGVVVGTSVTIATQLFVDPVSFSEIFLIPARLWVLLMAAFGLKKRRRPWGVVYDSVTKQPLDPAYVTLKGEDGKEIASSITDLDGRFGFVVPESGNYAIFAKKTNYAFPSQNLVGHDHDELYRDLYFGEFFHVESAGDVAIKNIPMDPQNFDWNEFAKRTQHLMKFYSVWDNVLRPILDIFFGIGFTIAAIAILVAPKTYNIAIFVLYVLLFCIRHSASHSRPYGKLSDSTTGDPLSFGIIRIYSTSTGFEIMQRISDARGRYYALLSNGNYKIRIDRKLPDGTYQTVGENLPVTVTKGYLSKNFEVEMPGSLGTTMG